MKIKEWNEKHKNYFPVGEGWRPLVENLVFQIACIDPDIEVSQVKEKFGTLRFYISGGNDEVYDLIEQAEILSGITCEHCGTTENVTTEGGWILTLCTKCRKERK